MPIWIVTAGQWLFKNPIVIAVVILAISTTFFFVQAKYHKRQADAAITRAMGAERQIEAIKRRDEALKQLELKQRKEHEEVKLHIAGRTYFDSLPE